MWRVGLMLSLAGCGASMVLQAPVESGCEEAGLKGCPEIAEGVLLVVEGDKPAGMEKLKAGAGANQPDELVAFAKALKGLGSLPGVQSYMVHVVEVCKVIEELAEARKKELAAAGGDVAGAEPGADGGSGEIFGSAEPKTAGGSRQLLTADTDASRLMTATFQITADNKELCDTQNPFGAMCGRAAVGPVVVTGIEIPAGCSVYAAALPPGDAAPAWQLNVSEPRHGMRLLVRAGYRLVLRADATGEAASCRVTWSGFRPYDSP